MIVFVPPSTHTHNSMLNSKQIKSNQLNREKTHIQEANTLLAIKESEVKMQKAKEYFNVK